MAKLDEISVNFINANRKKGAKPRKPEDQFQPDYVAKAKKHAEAEKAEALRRSTSEMLKLKLFFAKHNTKARRIYD